MQYAHRNNGFIIGGVLQYARHGVGFVIGGVLQYAPTVINYYYTMNVIWHNYIFVDYYIVANFFGI